MEIHDTAKLVERAVWHSEIEKGVVGGHYGLVSLDGAGDIHFEGCWIGCLSTPHGKAALRSYATDQGWTGVQFTGFDDDRQVEDLEREFGLNHRLVRLQEYVFENLPGKQTEGPLFVVETAKAFVEGSLVTVEDADNWRSYATRRWGDEQPGHHWREPLLEWLAGMDSGQRPTIPTVSKSVLIDKPIPAPTPGRIPVIDLREF